MATGALSPSTAEGKEAPRVADFDELVDEVLARKGPSKYTDGLSEDNWEEVSKTSDKEPSGHLTLNDTPLGGVICTGVGEDSSLHDESTD